MPSLRRSTRNQVDTIKIDTSCIKSKKFDNLDDGPSIDSPKPEPSPSSNAPISNDTDSDDDVVEMVSSNKGREEAMEVRVREREARGGEGKKKKKRKTGREKIEKKKKEKEEEEEERKGREGGEQEGEGEDDGEEEGGDVMNNLTTSLTGDGTIPTGMVALLEAEIARRRLEMSQSEGTGRIDINAKSSKKFVYSVAGNGGLGGESGEEEEDEEGNIVVYVEGDRVGLGGGDDRRAKKEARKVAMKALRGIGGKAKLVGKITDEEAKEVVGGEERERMKKRKLMHK